jgi:hypothetical protein
MMILIPIFIVYL